jgi:hypothetical protein
MPAGKLTDTEIAIRIVPRRLRWPETGTTIAWTGAHACVDALQELVRNVDLDLLQAEENKELSAGGIARRRAEFSDQALRKLANFRPFDIAQKALSENIVALERLSNRNPAQVQMLQKLKKALQDLREGIEATKRMLLEQCKNARRAGYDQFSLNRSTVGMEPLGGHFNGAVNGRFRGQSAHTEQ